MILLELEAVDLVKLHKLNPVRYPFLLENQMIIDKQQNQYSLLFAFPKKTIVLNHWFEFDFLESLDQQVRSTQINYQSKLPFIGGYFVYLSYELVGQIEPKLQKNLITNTATPIAYAVRIDTAIIIDHCHQKTWLVSQLNNIQEVDQIREDITQSAKLLSNQTVIQANIIDKERDYFIQKIQDIKTYIRAGDVFQVNLSRAWQIQLSKDYPSSDIYQALMNSNTGAFCALASFAGLDILSSSPERLFQVKNGVIQTRPIAGTCPRGDVKHDKVLQQELLQHPKEQAEHIMLLDLERNDMGKVCQYGSIKVNELMNLESYPSVHHIVSNITGCLRKGMGVDDIIRAIFPGGTITGCPKIRCMEIIAQLEQVNRGAYTGSLGYISDHGKMDFNILIRTLVKQGGQVNLRTGAGIVYDSDSNKEADETEHKAKAILNIFFRK